MFMLSFPQLYPSTPNNYLTHLYVHTLPSLLYNTKQVFFCTKLHLPVAPTPVFDLQTFLRQSIDGSTDSLGLVIDKNLKLYKRQLM